MGLRSLDDSREGIGRFLLRNPETCFVVCDDGITAGVILCGHDGRRAYIYHAAVDERFRGRGYGKQLVAAVLTSLQGLQIRKAALVVYGTNDDGNGFWEHLGFQVREDLVYRDHALIDQ